jgi:hypothetical protein
MSGTLIISLLKGSAIDVAFAKAAQSSLLEHIVNQELGML